MAHHKIDLFLRILTDIFAFWNDSESFHGCFRNCLFDMEHWHYNKTLLYEDFPEYRIQ